MTSTTLHRSDFKPGIAGWQGGSGPPLLLIHGVGLNADAWGPMLPYLTKHFFVTVIDMPGHGRSARLPESAQLTDFSDRISQILTQPTIVVGHSMGALIAMDLAVRHAALVSAIVPLNAIYRRTDHARDAVKHRAQSLITNTRPDPTETLNRWFGDQPQGHLAMARDDCREWLLNVDPIGYRQAYSVFANEEAPSDEALSNLSCPALFITGEQEPNSTPEMTEALAQLVPSGRSIVVKAARHMMPMTHAECVSEHICKFCQETAE